MIKEVTELAARINEYRDYLVAFLFVALGKAAYYFVPRLRAKIDEIMVNRRKDAFMHTIFVNSVIQNSLAELRIEMQADRAFVYQFHNGTHFVNETMHTYYYSCTYESAAVGLKLQPGSEKRPVSGNVGSITRLMLEKQFHVNDVNDVDNTHFKHFYANFGAESFAVNILTNSNDEVTGFICVAWNSPRNITEAELAMVSNFASVFKYL